MTKEMTKPIYNIDVQLTGRDGNAFSCMAHVVRALRKHGVKQVELDDFMDQAMSGNYNNLLQVCMKWVNVK